VVLFTRDYGKISARAVSARKITSKLSAHLQPGQHILARVIEKNSLLVGDAFCIGSVRVEMPVLAAVASLLPEFQPDEPVWEFLASRVPFSWERVLSILGWDPTEARCTTCSSSRVSAFLPGRQDFSCQLHAPFFSGSGQRLIYLAT
jgi:recombinational DNA repair protein (RecF pathway)